MAVISGQAAAQSWLLTDAESGVEKGNWQVDSQQLKLSGSASALSKKSCMAANRRVAKC